MCDDLLWVVEFCYCIGLLCNLCDELCYVFVVVCVCMYQVGCLCIECCVVDIVLVLYFLCVEIYFLLVGIVLQWYVECLCELFGN